MSLNISRDNCTLNINWPSTRSGTIASSCKFIVIVRDVNAGRRLVTTPLPSDSPVLRIAIPPDFCNQSLVVTAHLCEPVTGEEYEIGWKAVESRSAVYSPAEESFLEDSDQLFCEHGQTKETFVSFEKPCVTVMRDTYSSAAIRWWTPDCHLHPFWFIVVTKETNLSDKPEVCFFFMDGAESELYLPLILSAGCQYKATVSPMSRVFCDAYIPTFMVFQNGTVDFRAELTLADQQELYEAAVKYCGDARATPCVWLYRNKSTQYFHDILWQNFGVMRTYIKDQSGDPASPINGRVNGLFFMADNVDGEPPQTSQFGRCRFQVPSEELLASVPNIYFVDFYCMRGRRHYVTLVATRPDSAADRYCSGRLLPLDVYDWNSNPFLFYRDDGWYVTSHPTLHVEVLYTENINVSDWMNYHGAEMHDVTVVCKGSSDPYGVPKNPSCTTCNLPA